MRKKIGECLIQADLITDEDLQIALAEHKRTGERVGAVLVRLNFATEKQITKALAYQLGFPYASLIDEPPDPQAIVLIPKDVALKRVCVAVRLEKNLLTVAMSDPLLFSLVQDLEFQTGYRIKQVVATRTDILKAIENGYPDKAIAKYTGGGVAAGLVVPAPMPGQKGTRPGEMSGQAGALSGMGIAEKRLPQDGRLRETDGGDVDVRVSTLRTSYGEVLRVPLRATVRIAAAAAIVTVTGWLAYQYSPYAPARPVDHRMAADSPQMPAPTSGTSPAALAHVSTRVSSPNAVPPQTVPSSPSTGVSTPAAPVATAPSPARVDTQPQSQLPPPPAAAAVVAETPVARLAPPPAPLHAAPHADPAAMESVPVRADTSPRRPVPLKDAVPSVDSILVSQERRLAIVEARVVSVGDPVGPRVVVEIERDAVVLQEPSGHQIRIPIRGERVVR